MVTEYKNIPISQIVPNPEQPREHFDREKLKELAESILSNGLINPVTVQKKGKQYRIVAGERRWKAHQIAKIKTIPAIVREYKNDGEVAVESLIENVHREDLTPQEKGKFCCEIMKIEKIKSVNELTKRIGSNLRAVQSWVDDYEYRVTTRSNADHTLIRATQGIEQKDREKIIKYAEKKGIASRKMEEKFVPIIKQSQPEVKDALLDDKITVEQAESLTKINSPKAREKALKETISHKKLADITPKLAEKSKPELTDALKKSFNSYQKIIFTNLYDAKVSIIKANKFLPKANEMLRQLMQKQFEYGDEKTLKTTITQMKSIFDEINRFNMHTENFEELKEQFVERIENKDDNC